MLKNNVLWPASRRFRSRSEWEPIGFFSEALCNSTKFDIKLGFFSSSAINVLSDGFATFLYNGGKMRMIINDVLSIDDHKAFMVGESDVTIPYFDLKRLAEIKNVLSIRDQHFFECLAWLIKNDRLEIKIVVPKYGDGIAHTKCGVFYDGLNRVAFDGSCNFSRTALIENLESITAFCDWDGKGDVCKIDDIAEDFERTFAGNDDSVEYLKVDDVKAGITDNFKNKDIDELVRDEQNLISRRLVDNLPPNIVAILNKAKGKVETIIKQIEDRIINDEIELTPRFPYDEPREYQKKAFNNWKKSQCGLFNMATGTGKTLTSLNCLLQIYKQFGYYKAIILVPTVTLVEQWEKECKKFNFQHIVKVCSKNKDWKGELDMLTMKENFNPTNSPINYVVISTYASFARDNVFHELMSLSKKCLLIADEAHNMGSKRILDRIDGVSKRFKRRIGLSATPERQFDDKGNRELQRFFNSENGYTFVYTMEEAIKNKFLCEYYYFPHVVRLCDDEMYDYMEISEKLGKIYRYNGGYLDLEDEIVRALLLKRRRIIHKARNKQEAFKNIIEERYKEKGNLKYTLVYVPEGIKPDSIADVYDSSDIVEDDIEADKLIDEFTQIVMNVSKTTTVRKFVSGQKNRETILEDFANGDLEVLTSMKCLDEGVDVPRSEMAIFCASTGNPRQFIQRRGRILRTHKDKKYAYIHDLVVVPDIGADCVDYEMERKLILSELKRVRDFASLSRNLDYSYKELEEVLNFYNVPLLD